MRITQNRLVKLSAAVAASCLLLSCGDSSRTATIKRDTYGIPHVYASDVKGLFFGFGYAVAEDRLFQLEMAKRSGNGTAAQVLGPNYVAVDTATLSSLDPASIRAQLDALSADDRAMFDGYAAGVNTRVREVLANKSELLPKQFADNGFEPTEWTADDVAMVWIGLILNRFFGGNSEVSNLTLLNQLKAAKGSAVGQQIYDQIRWLEDPTAPTIIPRDAKVGAAATPSRGPRLAPISMAAATAHRERQIALMGLAATEETPTASNAWVLAPSRTTEGRAILYNGPQQGFNNPAFQHGIGLHGAGYDVTGSTPIGLLPVLFGTNGTIAWGSTVGSLDTNDTYQEQLNPANQYEYMFNGAYRPMTKRTAVIKVKGQADRSVDIYSTVHGFIDSFDLPNNTAYTTKRTWQGREVETMIGWAKAAQAKNWDEYMVQAARVSSSITWFYADVAGNIGVAALGTMPKRLASQDIRFPALGTGSMEWQGMQPFSDNPKSLNPAQGALASWNNQIVAGLRADSANFSYVDRVNEVAVQLAAKPKFSAEDVWKVGENAGMADLNARYFIPIITSAAQGLPATDPVRQAADALAAWDGQNRDANRDGFYDGPGTTILRAWLTIMTRVVLQDDLPPAVYNTFTALGYPAATGTNSPGSVQPARTSKLLWNALQGTASGVPQSYDFLNGQSPAAVVRAALAETVTTLKTQFGDDMAKWLTPVAPHRFSPINAAGVPWAGVSELQEVSPYMNRGTVVYRVIMQPGAVTMCSAMPPGQSGFISPAGVPSKHYSDQLELYRTFACKADRLTADQVDQNLESVKNIGY